MAKRKTPKSSKQRLHPPARLDPSRTYAPPHNPPETLTSSTPTNALSSTVVFTDDSLGSAGKAFDPQVFDGRIFDTARVNTAIPTTAEVVVQGTLLPLRDKKPAPESVPMSVAPFEGT